jgi:bifunctional DNA-binding transcriptional regulator/antitoxin component of YhaV-PrlF toxin-antitoxin module
MNKMDDQLQGESWTLHVDEDGVLTLPDELWDTLGWSEGDEIEFLEQEDGSFLLVKADPQDGVEEEVESSHE